MTLVGSASGGQIRLRAVRSSQPPVLVTRADSIIDRADRRRIVSTHC